MVIKPFYNPRQLHLAYKHLLRVTTVIGTLDVFLPNVGLFVDDHADLTRFILASLPVTISREHFSLMSTLHWGSCSLQESVSPSLIVTVRLVSFEGVIFSRISWVIEQHENWNPRIL